MLSGKKTRYLNMVCIGLVLAAGCLRVMVKLKYEGIVTYNLMICALFIAAACIWICQLQRRLLQPAVRKNLIGVAGLIIFWIVIRTLKYEFTPKLHFTERYTWYLYYIPMILIPLLMFFAVLYIGRPQGRSLDRRWKLLWGPAAALIIGMLTNDFHQMAFHFSDGLPGSGSYSYGPVYYLSIGWMGVMFLSILIVVLVRCAVPANRKKIWIPMIPLMIGVLYLLGVIAGLSETITRFLTVPEMGCFIFASFMESLICVHLFPSNDRYEDFFQAASIFAGIMDDRGVIRYESTQNMSVTPEQVRLALETDVCLEGGDMALRSHRIHGGFGYWVRELSEINLLNSKLEDIGDVLEAENIMLEAENKIEEECMRIREQNRLYDGIAKDVRSHLDKISKLIDLPPEDEAEFEMTMKYACILNVYVKRRSNLLLLSHQSSMLGGDELRLAVAESLEYVRLYGVSAHVFCKVDGMIPGQIALTAYEIFEDILESVIPGTDAILVILKISEDILQMRMTLDRPGGAFDAEKWNNRAGTPQMTLHTEIEQDTAYIDLVLPLGGELS